MNKDSFLPKFVVIFIVLLVLIVLQHNTFAAFGNIDFVRNGFPAALV